MCWCVGERIARAGQIIEQGHYTCWHVEPDREPAAAGCAGVVGHQHGDPSVAMRQSLQAHQCRGAISNKFNSVWFG